MLDSVEKHSLRVASEFMDVDTDPVGKCDSFRISDEKFRADTPNPPKRGSQARP